MKEQIHALRQVIKDDASNVDTTEALESFRNTYLARKGKIAALFEQMKDLPKEDKPWAGKELNALRTETEDLYASLEANVGGESGDANSIDYTLPGRSYHFGHRHIVSQTIEDIKAIFKNMGFSVVTGPEIETDYYNFESLNFPPDHPARDMQDTFFVTPDIVLRTHTSPVQTRVMEQQEPPIRAIMPGKVYRNEVVTARSHMQFHQVEGLCVDTDITFADLKGTMVHFAKQYYGESLKYRFRASYFPFTEPSAEMDITCYLCAGEGCRVCKNSGWLEILGCGMVDPNVFKSSGIDPERYTGYAFGMGVERTAMLRHGITDIRLLFENDLRVNKQFY
ncbi:MAG: phenylalanine--tRNA ligase subunit alpha [Ectothiorhodospiraceae bacterium]|nr:phenylalanine--tRNA ligase subunit alpha [Ectothiorhodospiraceae bacterium]